MHSVIKKDLKKNRRANNDDHLTISRQIMVIRSLIKKLGFGSLLMFMSVTLICSVGLYIVSKLTYGIDLPYVSLAFIQQSDKLGQFGDFFGGVLNPLLSFMALLGVLYTIRSQGKELKEAREETRIANRIQDKQSAIFERQNFESVFFRLLDVHASIAERIRSKVDPWTGNGFESTVHDVLQQYSYLYDDRATAQMAKPKPQYDVLNSDRALDEQLLLDAFEEGVGGEKRVMLSQYYRNLYQILKLVDGFKVFTGEDQAARRSYRHLRIEYFQRRQYSNILRAQLSDDELKLLFFNCLTPYGAGLKVYVEQYSLLKHLQKSKFLNKKAHLFGVYEDTAYADYEDISLAKILDFTGSGVRNRLKNMYSTKRS
jgi:hypothetical protein